MTETQTKRIIRPSSLPTLMYCPRRWWLDFISQGETSAHPSAAAVGTAVHKAAELYWSMALANGGEKMDVDISALIYAAQQRFREIESTDGLNWAEDHTMDIALSQIEAGVKVYHDKVIPMTQVPLAVEQKVSWEIDHPMVSAVSGTIDSIYPDHIVDIKCRMGARKKNTSEFSLQQSTYVMLAQKNGYPGVRSSQIHQILLQNSALHNEDCFIHISKVEYLIDILLKQLQMVYEGASPEVVFSGNPNQYLCNKKWCDYWENCRFARGDSAGPKHVITNIGNHTTIPIKQE